MLGSSRPLSMLDFLAAITRQEENTAQKIRVGPRVTEGTTGCGNLREDILHEIAQLSHVVFKIENDFTIIAKSIQRFDEAEALRDTAGHPLQFIPEWNSFRQIYGFLLNSSRSTAKRLKRKSDSSLKALIPLINNSSASLGNKQVYVIEFIKSLDEFQVQGAGTVQEFYELRERIRNFERDLNREMETQDTDAEQRIKEILDSIKQLEAEIKAASGFFAACRSVIDVRKVLSSASVIAFAPVSSALSLVSGVKSVGNAISQGLDRRAQEIQGKKDNILSLQLEKESLGSRLVKLREIRPEITELTSTFDEIVSELGAMQRMWKMISSDAVGLQEAMRQLRSARTSVGFDKRVPDVEKLWRALARTLDGFAYGVGPSWNSIVKRYWPFVLTFFWELLIWGILLGE